MLLGQYLRELRGGRRVVDVISAVGINSRQTLYTWEGPHSRPEPEDIVKLLQHYGCTDEQIDRALRLRAGLPALPAPPAQPAGAA